MTPRVCSRDQFKALRGHEETVECRRFGRDAVRAFEVATGIGDVPRDPTDRDSFPGAIVPGFYTLSLVDALISSVLIPTADEYFINYGLEDVRFLAPIYFDDVAQFRFRIEDTRDRDGGLRIEFSFQFLAEDRGSALAVGTWLVLLTQREPTMTELGGEH